MFNKSNEKGYCPVFDGIERKTLVYGEKTLMSEFRMKKDCTLPMHAHPHEQTGYLISGRIRLLIESKFYEVKPGDSWCISGSVEHGAEIIEDSVAVEVFSPTREEYIPEETDE